MFDSNLYDPNKQNKKNSTLMLIVLGFGSQMTGVESFVVTIMDFWPTLQKRRPLVLGIVCLAMYICGLPMCTGVCFCFQS